MIRKLIIALIAFTSAASGQAGQERPAPLARWSFDSLEASGVAESTEHPFLFVEGVLANPLPGRPAWGDANLSKDGKTLYLHVMKWPADGKLTVEGVTPKVESVTFLAPKAADTKIAFTQDGANLNLTLSGTAIDPHDTVVKASLAGPFPTAK